ncbi:MAG: FtsK/SpoIIIE domain-containing protein [Clostridium sp.]|nr:FtsK/SpoIIIE domain-containing protein [Clostridium sp.]MCM1547758.1 FtsK/SpoIIIE domain-containing protein [Ruminococcus sp.]
MNIKQMSRFIKYLLSCHNVPANVKPEGTITSPTSKRAIFKVNPKAGTKIKRLFACAPDIKACLQFGVFELFKENGQIYLAVSSYPNNDNKLMPILKSTDFRKSQMQIPIVLGYDMLFRPYIADLAEMPHILYGGATGMGKSVALQVLILCAIWKNPAQNVNLIIFDVGANDLNIFDGIQHLSYPIVKDETTSVYVIGELLKEMEDRINLSNAEIADLPAIILVIDEIVSLLKNILLRNCTKLLRTP